MGDSEEPFAALVVYREPASALPPPAPYDRMFADGAADPRAAWHDGALRYVDLRLREVADALTAAGRWERTLVVVTATHGQSLDGQTADDPGFSPAGLHIPLLLRAPGRVPRGFVVDEAHGVSAGSAPTILSLAHVVALDAPMQGRTLLRDGAATPGPSFAFAEAFRRSRLTSVGRRSVADAHSSSGARTRRTRSTTSAAMARAAAIGWRRN
jgi:arylsulfatase A-like enzyme